MPVLQADDMRDLIIVTQKELGRLKFEQIATRIQDYVFARELLKNERVTYASGYGIQKNVMVDHSHAARHVGLYEEDSVAFQDNMTTLTIPFRHTTVPYVWDEREVAMNQGEARVVDYTKIKRTDAMIALIEKLEDTGWSKPADSSDTTTPWGIPYWLVKWPAGTTGGGFNGTNPVGFAGGAGGIDSATYSRWANYTCKHTALTMDGIVADMRTAWVKVGFKNPIDIPDYKRGSDRYAVYTNYAVLGTLEKLLISQNQNLGMDLASTDGRATFRGAPIRWVPQLDADASNPVYMINWGNFNCFFLKGWYMKEAPPIRSAKSHNVWEVWVDLTWNTECTDRRKHAVISALSKTGTAA